MANLTRKLQKVFAQNATNNGQFGSLQDGSNILSQDLDILQANPAFEEGWNDAVISAEELPALEEMQSLTYMGTRQITYLLNKGIPEWEIGTEYFIGDIQREVAGTKLYRSEIDNNTGLDIAAIAYNAGTTYAINDVAMDTNGDIYKSLTNGNIGNPLTDPTNWELAWLLLGDLDDLKNLTLATETVAGISLLSKRITVSSGADTAHDIGFSAGNFIFNDGSGQAVTSALTKQLDSTFVLGDNAGGMAQGVSLPTNGTVYLFALSTEDGSLTDYIGDTNINATNALADSVAITNSLTKFKRVGSLRTDNSSNIRAFDQQGNEFIYRGYILDRVESLSPTSPALLTLTVPPNTIAINTLFYNEDGGANVFQLLFCATNHSNLNASTTNFTMRSETPGGAQQSYSQPGVRTKTNASSQVNLDSNSAETFQVLTTGYVDWDL